MEKVLPSGIVRDLTEEEMNIYRAPYTEAWMRKPLWRWPNEIPIEGEPSDMNEVVGNYNQKLVEWDVRKLLFYAEPGAILPKPLVEWCEVNLKNFTSINLGKGLHCLPEDHPQVHHHHSVWAFSCRVDRNELAGTEGKNRERALTRYCPLKTVSPFVANASPPGSFSIWIVTVSSENEETEWKPSSHLARAMTTSALPWIRLRRSSQRSRRGRGLVEILKWADQDHT